MTVNIGNNFAKPKESLRIVGIAQGTADGCRKCEFWYRRSPAETQWHNQGICR